ncbi:unnamed protein product [Amoebophrya sp. A25]|nr:unnamed protein product [Amoebophrya sp. A25]|eukprot:GSA25T00021503001.1
MWLQLLSDVSGIRVVSRDKNDRNSRPFFPRIELDVLRFCTFSVSVAGGYWLASRWWQHANTISVPPALTDQPGASSTLTPSTECAENLSGVGGGSSSSGNVDSGRPVPSDLPPVPQQLSSSTAEHSHSTSSSSSLETAVAGRVVGSLENQGTVLDPSGSGGVSTTTELPLVSKYVSTAGRIVVPLSEFLSLLARKAVTAVSYDTIESASVFPPEGAITFAVKDDVAAALLPPPLPSSEAITALQLDAATAGCYGAGARVSSPSSGNNLGSHAATSVAGVRVGTSQLSFTTNLVPGCHESVYRAIENAKVPLAAQLPPTCVPISHPSTLPSSSVVSSLSASSTSSRIGGGFFTTDNTPTASSSEMTMIQDLGIVSASSPLGLGNRGGAQPSQLHIGRTTSDQRNSASRNKEILVGLAVDLFSLSAALACCYYFYDNPLSGGIKDDNVWKAAGSSSDSAGPGIGFDDVAGFRKQKEELREVIAYIKRPELFQRVGAIPALGTLLVGPPGCGKTLLARAVATEAGVPFFHASASGFVEKYVGVGASRVRKFFQNAQNYPASILFLDELEAIGSRDDSLGSGEYCQTISQLLVELDGMHLKRRAATANSSSAQQQQQMAKRRNMKIRPSNAAGKTNGRTADVDVENNQIDEDVKDFIDQDVAGGDKAPHSDEQENRLTPPLVRHATSWCDFRNLLWPFSSANRDAKTDYFDIDNEEEDSTFSFMDPEEGETGERGGQDPHRGPFFSNLQVRRTRGDSNPTSRGSGGESFFVFLAATNRHHTLDPALLRPGRLDRIVKVKYPSQTTRHQCVLIHARGKQFHPTLTGLFAGGRGVGSNWSSAPEQQNSRSSRIALNRRDASQTDSISSLEQSGRPQVDEPAPQVNFAARLARKCRGFSCAEIANVLNEAALLAARRGAKQRRTSSTSSLKTTMEASLEIRSWSITWADLEKACETGRRNRDFELVGVSSDEDNDDFEDASEDETRTRDLRGDPTTSLSSSSSKTNRATPAKRSSGFPLRTSSSANSHGRTNFPGASSGESPNTIDPNFVNQEAMKLLGQLFLQSASLPHLQNPNT